MTRKHISLRGSTYAKAKSFCVLAGITAGQFVEKLCLHFLETREDLTLKDAMAGGRTKEPEPKEEEEEPEDEPTPPPDHNYGLPRKDTPPKSKPNPPRGGGVHFF